MTRPELALRSRLADRRSGRVVFVSHCLLNENVRYLGGACRPGPVREWLRAWESDGVGICQMPCPEQRVWGGVLKRSIAPAFGARGTLFWPLRGVLLWLFAAYTRMRYRWIARGVAAEIRDYRRSGFDVVAVVGVGASPSCGVGTTLDVKAWLEDVGRLDRGAIDAQAVNRAVAAAARPGMGWFTSALDARLRRDGMAVPLEEHDLLAELREGARDEPPVGARAS